MVKNDTSNMTYDQLVDFLLDKKRKELQRKPRKLVEQIAKETMNSNSPIQCKMSQLRKHVNPNIRAIVAKLYDELPFVGMMIHGYKHPR